MSFYFIVFATYSYILFSQAKSEYILNAIDVEWNITTENNLEMNWEISRVSRGVYTFSGFMDFKNDINTDKSKQWVDISYSRNGISYMLTPLRCPPTIMTEFLDVFYRNYIMEPIRECCVNPLAFDGKFSSPLTKRRMICRNCLPETDTFPSNLRRGYYKLSVFAKGDIGYVLMLLVHLDWE